jgi:hypothetical protein
VVSGSIAGGIASEIYGGNFWEGFARGAATAAAEFFFNYMCHPEGLKTFPWLKQKAIPGQHVAVCLLPGAVIAEAGILSGTMVLFSPEIGAFIVRNGTIYVLGNARTYEFIVEFLQGCALISPPGASSTGGSYAGSFASTIYRWLQLVK